jgi:hypothetical protein
MQYFPLTTYFPLITNWSTNKQKPLLRSTETREKGNCENPLLRPAETHDKGNVRIYVESIVQSEVNRFHRN